MPDPTDSNERGLIAERMNVIADEVEVLASSVMGLTVGCARCHNHKYDPIPQRDYYRLSAILQAAYDPYEWMKPKKRELDLAHGGERKEVAENNAPIQAEIKALQQQIATPPRPSARRRWMRRSRRLRPKSATLCAPRPRWRRTERDEAQRALAEKYKDAFPTDRNWRQESRVARQDAADSEGAGGSARQADAGAARARAGR